MSNKHHTLSGGFGYDIELTDAVRLALKNDWCPDIEKDRITVYIGWNCYPLADGKLNLDQLYIVYDVPHKDGGGTSYDIDEDSLGETVLDDIYGLVEQEAQQAADYFYKQLIEGQ